MISNAFLMFMKHPTAISLSSKDYDILDTRFWSAFVKEIFPNDIHIDVYGGGLVNYLNIPFLLGIELSMHMCINSVINENLAHIEICEGHS